MLTGHLIRGTFNDCKPGYISFILVVTGKYIYKKKTITDDDVTVFAQFTLFTYTPNPSMMPYGAFLKLECVPNKMGNLEKKKLHSKKVIRQS